MKKPVYTKLRVQFEKQHSSFGRYDAFTLEKLTETVLDYAKETNTPVENVTMEFHTETSYYDSIESYLQFRSWREETDKEFNDRVAKQEVYRVKQEAYDKKIKAEAKILREENEKIEYDRLKNKFENRRT
jgi:hypothetical protein